MHSNFNVRTSHMFSLRDPYILFLEVILHFKSQSYKSQKKYLDVLLILFHLLNPYTTWKCICISRKGAFFLLHFRQFYHGSILYGPWLDCFHQQTELGPYWVILSGGIRDIAWRQMLKWNKQLYNDYQYISVWKSLTRRKAPARSLCHRLGLPQDDRPMSVRFYGPCKGVVRRPCGLPTTIARVYDHFWAKMTI